MFNISWMGATSSVELLCTQFKVPLEWCGHVDVPDLFSWSLINKMDGLVKPKARKKPANSKIRLRCQSWVSLLRDSLEVDDVPKEFSSTTRIDLIITPTITVGVLSQEFRSIVLYICYNKRGYCRHLAYRI